MGFKEAWFFVVVIVFGVAAVLCKARFMYIDWKGRQ